MTDKLLQISKLDIVLPEGSERNLAVEDLNIELSQGETLCIVGESGSGKSTLLSMICGTISARQGEVTLDGCPLSRMSPAARDRLRGETVGVIFQQFNLLPFGSVADNILLPLRFAPTRRTKVGTPRQAVETICGALGLSDVSLNQRVGALSVGQQQRVAVARALIGQPPLIVADEPTSALDYAHQSAFLDLLFDQVRSTGAALLMVSHDARIATRFDRVVEMSEITKASELRR